MGMSERVGRTLAAMVQCMLADSRLREILWGVIPRERVHFLGQHVSGRLGSSSEELPVGLIVLREHFFPGLGHKSVGRGCANECLPSHVSSDILSSSY